MENFFQVIMDMVKYIIEEVPTRIMYHIFMVIAMVVIAYALESIIFGIPVVIWEAVTKKKIPFETKEKVAFRVTTVFTIVLVLILLYQQVT